jgi:hypothetical protein
LHPRRRIERHGGGRAFGIRRQHGNVIATSGIPGVTPMVDVGGLIRIVTDTGT